MYWRRKKEKGELRGCVFSFITRSLNFFKIQWDKSKGVDRKNKYLRGDEIFIFIFSILAIIVAYIA